jgi:hypothetical protein
MPNSIADEVLNAIEYAIDKTTSNLRRNYVKTAIKYVSSDGKYTVTIDGADYTVPTGCGMKFVAGEKIWVHIPEGNLNNAYICASAEGKIITGGGGGETIYIDTEPLTEADINSACN